VPQQQQQRNRAQEDQQAQQEAQRAERTEQQQSMNERAPAAERLLEQVEDRQESSATLHAEQRTKIIDRRQELAEEFEEYAGNRQEDGLDMRADDLEAGQQAIEAFANKQLRALAVLSEATHEVAEGQKWDVRDLRESQSRRQELTNPQATAQPDNQIGARAEEQAKQECDKLEEHFNQQLGVLQMINAALDTQMGQHRSQLQDALYAELSGAAYQAGLQDVLRRQEADREALKKDLRGQLTQLHREHEREMSFGAQLPYRQQAKAERDKNNVRLSENEHIRARINLVLQTLNERTEASAYERDSYRDSVTLRIPRDMAVLKTRMDLELRDQLRESIEEDRVSETLLNEIEIEADIERTIRARDLTIQSRQAENRAIDDLLAITDQRIRETAILQSGELRSRQLPQELAEASEKEWRNLHKQIDRFFEEARRR
jgi:hypothetical protein